MSSIREEGRAWFALLAGVPALLGWVGYGLAWLLAPHLPAQPDPLIWAACAAGGWYALLLTFTVGPVLLMGMG